MMVACAVRSDVFERLGAKPNRSGKASDQERCPGHNKPTDQASGIGFRFVVDLDDADRGTTVVLRP